MDEVATNQEDAAPEEVSEDDRIGSDDLASLPPDRLAQMLREKRRAEAGVRQKLRDLEESHGALQTAVTGFRGRQVRAAAESAGVLSEALDDVVSSLPVGDILAEDGTVDEAGLAAALASLRQQKPFYWPTHKLPPSSGGGHFGPREGGSSASWGDIIGG